MLLAACQIAAVTKTCSDLESTETLLMPFSDERLALARERALSLAASRTAAAGATSPGGTSPVLLAVATGLPEAEVEPPQFPTLEAEDPPKQVRLAEGSLVLLVNDMKSRLGGHEGRTIMAVTLAGDGSSDSECRVDRRRRASGASCLYVT